MFTLRKQGTLGSSSDSNDTAAIPIAEFARIFSEIGARNEVIDQAQKLVRGIVIQFIDINNDRDARFTGPSCGLKRGGRVAAIKMKDEGVHYGFPLKLPGRIGQPRVVMPQNRSFPYTFF